MRLQYNYILQRLRSRLQNDFSAQIGSGFLSVFNAEGMPPAGKPKGDAFPPVNSGASEDHLPEENFRTIFWIIRTVY